MHIKSNKLVNVSVCFLIFLILGFIIWEKRRLDLEPKSSQALASSKSAEEIGTKDFVTPHNSEDSTPSKILKVKKKNKDHFEQAHNHNDCLKAIEEAMQNGAMEFEAPEISEQEKFDFLLENPEVEAALEHYEEYIIDENGNQVRREDLEADFEWELEQLQAQGEAVGAIEN